MASRFWVGGTGTWDASDMTHWAALSGAAGGQSVPGSADDVTFDGSSGGGTVTVNTGFSVNSLTCGAFTGTLDFSVNNNSPTVGTGQFNISGSGTRTIKLGSGTFTLSGTGNIWVASTTANLTFNAGASTIAFSNITINATRSFFGGSLTYNNVTFGSNSTGRETTLVGGNTFAGITLVSPLTLLSTAASIQTVTSSLTISGSGGVMLASSTTGTAATVSKSSGSLSLSGITLRNMTFSGGATFTASGYDLGGNTGITITAPSTGSGGGIRIAGHGGLAA